MESKPVTIAVDAMGGDNAPQQNISGAIKAAQTGKENLRIVLVGDVTALKPFLDDHPKNILIKHAPDIISMADHPVQAIKKKHDSSLVVAAQMVQEGEADALISAGNTGAATAAGLLIIGRIKGIDRPAIAAMVPTKKDFFLILDVGANADCKPENFVEFAEMGSVYITQMTGKNEPSVGLLNIGEESSKGNYISQKAHELLKTTDINFIGNVEGRDLPNGTADVVVCDGFTGNIVLKLMEGVSKAIFSELKLSSTQTLRGRLGAALLLSSLKGIKERLDPESYGGSLLLGLNGIVVIAHGSSSPKAIGNAIMAATLAVEQNVVTKIKDKMGS